MNGRHSTLDEFWPFYVSQHLNPANRRLHFAGTTAGLVLLSLAAAARVPALLAAALAAGYAPAWGRWRRKYSGSSRSCLVCARSKESGQFV